jgi:hypothetical protein
MESRAKTCASGNSNTGGWKCIFKRERLARKKQNKAVFIQTRKVVKKIAFKEK